MNVNDLAKMLGDACYIFLALNFIWGLYNIIMGFRRVKELSFSDHEEQAEFVDEVIPLLAGRPLRRRRGALPATMAAHLPQLTQLAVANRGLGYDQLRQVVTEVLQRDVMADLEYRTNWIATVIKCGPLLGPVRHGAGHDGRVRPHRHRRKGRALHDRQGNQHRAGLHGDGSGHRHPVQLHAGQPDDSGSQFSRRARRRPDARARFPENQLAKQEACHAHARPQLGTTPAPTS